MKLIHIVNTSARLRKRAPVLDVVNSVGGGHGAHNMSFGPLEFDRVSMTVSVMMLLLRLLFVFLLL